MFGKKKFNKKKSTELGQLFKKQLDEAKAQFAELEFESKSEDGTVSVVVTGTREIKSLSIAQELFDDGHDAPNSLHFCF